MTGGKENRVKRPSLFWLLTETGRAISEHGLSLPLRKFFTDSNQGDGHPVLVLPGFLGTDKSTSPLRSYIDKIGYTSYSWDLGRNQAKLEYLDLLEDRIDALSYRHGEQVSLIGWSLGGVFARQLAKAKPDRIRQVITLGSPFKGIHQPNNVAWAYNLISGGKRIKDLDPEFFADIPRPAPVPTTAIYTKQDGVVPWQLCLEEESEIHQNIEVRGSHLGLGVNPAVLRIITNRLLFHPHNWEHFVPKSNVRSRLLYPSL